MHQSLKALLALVFVAVLGTVLIQPILDSTQVDSTSASLPQGPEADENAPEAPSPEPEPTPSPEERTPTPSETTPQQEPTPEPSETEAAEEQGVLAGPLRVEPFLEAYPRSCSRGASARSSTRDIAVVRRGRLVVGSPSGRPSLTRRAGKVVGFDAGGRRLAALQRSATLLVGSTDRGSLKPKRQLTAWAWSPRGSCAFSVDARGSLQVHGPGRKVATLVDQDVKSFALSSDGRRIGLVLREGNTTSVWTAKLSVARMREVQRMRSGPRVSLKAWSPNGRILYLTSSRKRGLSFVAPGASVKRGRVTAARVDLLERCRDRLLAVVDGAVAELTMQGPTYLTKRRAGYTSLSCSPDAGFIAAIRSGRLVLLDRNGTFLRELATDSGYRDLMVDWGPRGAGLVFGRLPGGSKIARVWYIPEGSTARDTGLAYDAGRGLDWSASAPTGIPIVWSGS